MILILAGAAELDPEFGDLGTQLAVRRLGVTHRLLRRSDLRPQVVVRMLVRADQPTEPCDLVVGRRECGRAIDIVGAGHGSEVYEWRRRRPGDHRRAFRPVRAGYWAASSCTNVVSATNPNTPDAAKIASRVRSADAVTTAMSGTSGRANRAGAEKSLLLKYA